MKSVPRSLQEVVLSDYKSELDVTRQMIERVPEQHFEWRPHEKSMSLAALTTHLVNVLFWQYTILTQDEFDLSSVSRNTKAARSRDELLTAFDAHVSAIELALVTMTDRKLLEIWTLRDGEKVLDTRPRIAMLRSVGISHMVHHRAQVGVCLRLLDRRPPRSYGPIAEDMDEDD